MMSQLTRLAPVLMLPSTFAPLGTAQVLPPVASCWKRICTVCPATALLRVMLVTLPVIVAGSKTFPVAQSNVGVALCAGVALGV